MRWTAILLSLTVAAALAGCGPAVPRTQKVTLTVKETTEDSPIRMTVVVDGATIFGPLATLDAGESKSFALNDPPRLTQGWGQHTILYTFDRIGLPDEVGHASIQLQADNATLFEDNSNKVLTGFAPTYAFRYVIEFAKP